MINPNIPLGYSTLITVLIFFSGIQLLFLGIIDIYFSLMTLYDSYMESYMLSILGYFFIFFSLSKSVSILSLPKLKEYNGNKD